MYITGGLNISGGFRLNGEYVAAAAGGDTPDKRTQSSGTNISAITNQCVLLVQP